MRAAILTIAASFLLAFAGCGGDDSSTTSTAGDETSAAKQAPAEQTEPAKEKTKPKVTVPNGAPPKKLVENDLEVGTGPAAKAGDEVSLNYVGVGYDSGQEFDTSWGKEPLSYELGSGLVIAGWEQGIEGMKVGGRRELVIPPKLAYGPQGFPPAIGPNETLIFVVDLEAIK